MHRGVQWAVPPCLARGSTHYIVVPCRDGLVTVEGRAGTTRVSGPCRAYGNGSSCHRAGPSCWPVSPSCQPIVQAHSVNPSCQPIVPAHHASPSCQPIVQAHSTSPSCQPIKPIEKLFEFGYFFFIKFLKCPSQQLYNG